jgi:hypothetical protein
MDRYNLAGPFYILSFLIQMFHAQLETMISDSIRAAKTELAPANAGANSRLS